MKAPCHRVFLFPPRAPFSSYLSPDTANNPSSYTYPLRDYALALSDKIKGLETRYDVLLQPGAPFVVRLDGCSFKTFTHGFARPFDIRLTRAMIRTMNDLVEKTHACTGFTQSDEITLLYPPIEELSNYPYNGRISKIASVFASIAAARFNFHINSPAIDWSDRTPEVRSRVSSHSAFFDARAFSAPDPETAAEALIWRHAFDCRRNAIHTVGIKTLGHKAIQTLSIGQILSLLREQKDIDVQRDIPSIFLYGTFCKRKLVSVPFTHPLTGESGDVIRRRLENRVFDLAPYLSKATVDMAMAKHWETEHPASLFDVAGLMESTREAPGDEMDDL